MRELGLLLCRRVLDGSPPLAGPRSQPFCLPSPSGFVTMSRNDVLGLSGLISYSGRCIAAIGSRDRMLWAPFFGGLALSYANAGDLAVVAALARAAASLDLRHPWLQEAEEYILEQQQPAGYFGLIAPELYFSDELLSEQKLLLRLTVDSVWALHAIAQVPTAPAQDRRRLPA